MKKFSIAIFCFLGTIITQGQDCQTTGNSLTFNNACTFPQTLQNDNVVVKARNGIVLQPGFSIGGSAQLNGHSFKATVDHNYTPEPVATIDMNPNMETLPPDIFSGYVPISLGGTVDLSHSGAATYMLPIQVSPGSAGVQPNLSIVYSSQAGNGLLGYGWNLAGLSSISRVPKNPYYDNTTKPIAMDDTDALSLDGVRLIRQSETSNLYNPANDPFTTVEKSTDGFTVTTQDGVVMQYGLAGNSQIKAAGSSTPHAWALSRMINPDGNYIDYIYFNDASVGEHRISEIRYTGNLSGKAPYNSIKFLYDQRNDPNTFYVAGNKTMLKSVLSSIKVYCESTLAKDYGFVYGFDLYTKLQGITLTADGVKYAPTVINWGTFDYTPTIANAGMGPLARRLFYYGDLNGDGVIDQVYINGEYLHFKIGDQYRSILLRSKYIESIDVVADNVLCKDIVYIHYKYKNLILQNHSIIKYELWTELARYTLDSNIVEQIVYESEKEVCTSNYTTPVCPLLDHKFYFADFDNNGTIDRAVTMEGQLLDIVGIDGIVIPSAIGNFKELLFMDFNGDGRIDIMFYKENGTASIWTYDDESGLVNLNLPTSTYISRNAKEIFIGDYNGDGRTDFIGRNDSNWVIKHSTGTDFIEGILPERVQTILINIQVNNPNATVPIFELIERLNPSPIISTFDFNADGMNDLVFTQGTNVYIAISAGNVFNLEATITVPTGDYNHGTLDDAILLAIDKDGDGRLEIVLGRNTYKIVENPEDGGEYCYAVEKDNGDIEYRDPAPYQTITFPLLNGNDMRVARIWDGLDNNNGLGYRGVSNYVNINDANYQAPQFPLKLLKGSRIVAQYKTTYKAGSGLGTKIGEVKQDYYGGHYHEQGLGLLGFQKVTRRDEQGDIINKVETDYNFTLPDNSSIYCPYVKNVTVKTDYNFVVSEYTNTPTICGANLEKKLFKLVSDSESAHDKLKDVSKTTNYTYDNSNGRIDIITERTGDWTISTDFNFVPVGNRSSRLESKSVSTTNPQGTFTQLTSFTYEGGASFLPKTITSQGLTQTINSRDGYGNPTSVTVGDRITLSEYDTKGRFAISTTDPLGLTSKQTYRYSDGAVLTSTNPNGLITKMEYVPANSGLTTNTIYPDGNSSTSALQWTSGNDRKYLLIENGVDGSITETYYTSLGQIQSKQSKGYKGEDVWTAYTYTYSGKVHTIFNSAIYDNGMAYTHTYDEVNRLKTVTGPNNFSDVYVYVDNTVKKTNSETGVEKSFFDALGNVVRTYSRHGEVITEYKPNGKPWKITTGDIETEMDYDNRGNQTTLIDPSSGTSTYHYNIYNELEWQIDANGCRTDLQYQNGRLWKKTVTKEGETPIVEEYLYYDVPGKLGLLKSVSRNSVVETYDYDQFERQTSLTVSDGDKTYTTTYAYNSIGQIQQVTYPTGLTVTYEYDDFGHLTKIFDASNPAIALWHGDTKDARNKWTRVELGNGLETNFTYNPTNYTLERIQTGTNGNLGSVQDLGFTFNLKGQLENRTEGSLTEVFEYDTYNRLTTSNVNKRNHFQTFYHDNGNLRGTTAVSTYNYDRVKPYAVSEVNTPNSGGSQSPGINTTSTFTLDNRIDVMDNGVYKNKFAYGPTGHRFKVEHYERNRLQFTKFYADNSEFIYNSSNQLESARTFINTPSGTVIIYEANAKESQIYYVHTDYLGSWLTITNQNAQVVERYSYDAWGRPRNPDTWELLPIDASDALGNLSSMQPRFDRGYTGHEHMCGFGLINMNGRLYDPYLQRFLSPDPYVQAPGNAQNYNRYSYCLNNPLMFTDPSGEIIFTIIGALLAPVTGGASLAIGVAMDVTAAINVISNWDDINGTVDDGKINVGKLGMYYGIGSLNGAAAATGMPIVMGATGGVTSLLNSAVREGSFEDLTTRHYVNALIDGFISWGGAKLTTPSSGKSAFGIRHNSSNLGLSGKVSRKLFGSWGKSALGSYLSGQIIEWPYNFLTGSLKYGIMEDTKGMWEEGFDQANMSALFSFGAMSYQYSVDFHYKMYQLEQNFSQQRELGIQKARNPYINANGPLQRIYFSPSISHYRQTIHLNPGLKN